MAGGMAARSHSNSVAGAAIMSTLALLLPLLGFCAGDVISGKSCSKKPPTKSTETVLRESLLCHYEKEKNPSRDINNTISVTPIMKFRSIDYYGVGDDAVVNTITGWEWTDESLTWDAKAHNGIKSIWVNPDTIWTPEAFLYTTGEFTKLSGSKCKVTSAGEVSCEAPASYRIFCRADFTYWPLDNHTCSLWMATGAILSSTFINLSTEMLSVIIPNKWTNREWELLGVDVKLEKLDSPRSLYAKLVYEIRLKRHSAMYTATLLLPSFVLPVFTVASYWIDPENPIRIYLSCISIFTHVFYLQAMGYAAPPSGDVCPRFIKFYRDSTLLAGITLMLAVAMQWLSSITRAPPSWCCDAVNWILDKRALRILLLVSPEEQNSTEAESAVENAPTQTRDVKQPHSWKYMVLVTDRILFHVFMLVSSTLILTRVL